MTVTPAQQHALLRIAHRNQGTESPFIDIVRSGDAITVTIPQGVYASLRITLDPEGQVTSILTRPDSTADAWVDLRETVRARDYDEWVEIVAEFVARSRSWLPQLDAPGSNAKGVDEVLHAIPGDALLALTDPDRALSVAAVAAEYSVVLAASKALYQVRRDESKTIQEPAWYLLSSGRQAVYRTDASMILTALATTGNPFVANLPVDGAPTPKQAAAVVKVFAKAWAKRS